MNLTNKTTNLLAGLLLLLMLGLAFFSLLDDATTMDELAHIPAGYSYIAKKDMRLNPEHPPLLKDLSGLSILLGSKITRTEINFPENHLSWQQELNGQWDFGRAFLYHSGNDADKIVFWARLPMLLIMLVLGIYVFRWAKEIYGNSAGLIALFFYSFSPTFLAHSRYVTTDVGAAAAFFIAAYYLVRWLQKPNAKNLLLAGFVFGLALLTKFSLVLLIPYFIFLTAVWAMLKPPRLIRLIKCGFGLLLIGITAVILIWPVYLYHIWDYPIERQVNDTETILQTYGNRLLAEPVIWLSGQPLLRPYGQFGLGLLMVIQRAVGGNTTYFLGEISNTGWKEYFPIIFLIKVPLALFALILISIIFPLFQIKKPNRQWLKNNFSQFALLTFFAVYWFSTLRTNLNIGVRHILPTFPVLYILSGGQLAGILKNKNSILKPLILLLGVWYGFSAVSVYPYFLTYFNESVGGPENGYQYAVDSNLDWGQDLKRLTQFVKEKNIETVYVDYFGGDSPEYRLGGKFMPWWGERDPNDLPENGWLAVSATFLQGGRGEPVAGFNYPAGSYNWLNDYEPAAVIGHSIFVYHR